MQEALPANSDGAQYRYHYTVFGLSISSAIPLPELLGEQVSGPADVQIALGDIPPSQREVPGGFSLVAGGGILNIPGVARYLIIGGERIIVEPDPTGSVRHLRLYLLGSAMGALLHQRHLLPLHANAIDVSGHAVAFMGVSGAGKSTMAAWFHDRGYDVLSDDVCVITGIEQGEAFAQPGIPRLRLWRDALENSGRSAAEYDLAFDDADKYNVPTRQSHCSLPLPLGAVYLLDEPGSLSSEQVITRLRGIDAVDALIANTYRGAYARQLDGVRPLLTACRIVAASVPIYRVTRVWGREHIYRELARLERHALSAVT